jgi:hypothetical protein
MLAFLLWTPLIPTSILRPRISVNKYDDENSCLVNELTAICEMINAERIISADVQGRHFYKRT